MNLAQLLVRTSNTYPDHPSVLHGADVVLTYGQLADRSARLAAYWRNELGLKSGDRVALYMTNHVSYLEVLYAAWWAGLVVVPVNAKLHAREVEYILQDSMASILVVTKDLAPDINHLLAGVSTLRETFSPEDEKYSAALQVPAIEPVHQEPTDTAWLFYTSGTTGRPKGVMQSHRNLYAMTSCYFSDVDSVEEGDVIVYAAPMSHGAGLYNFAFVAHAARHVVPVSGGFDPEELVDLSQRIGQLCMFAAPTMVKRLVEYLQATGASAEGFKTIVYGGGPMYVNDIQAALRLMGPRFVQIYGQGESPMTITALPRTLLADHQHPEWQQRVASVGYAQTLVQVRVVNEDGVDVAPGDIGEVVVRGEAVMKGYWNNPIATEKAIRQGWLWTGDMGTLDAQGFLTLKDRSKDVIISGGSNIYPREVEEVLLQHPSVREVSVIGLADAEWGEVVVACIVIHHDASVPPTDELDQLCLDHIARFKRPKIYHFLDHLPKNNYGKVLKTALRENLHSMNQ